MKNLKTIIAIVALSFATVSVSATETEPTTAKKNAFRSQIVSLLGNDISSLSNGSTDIKASIKVMLNNNNELIVISTRTKSNSLDLYVKSRLNYKKVDVTGLKKGEVYTIPLTIKRS